MQHGDRDRPGCRHEGFRRLYLDITENGQNESRDNAPAQQRRTGSASSNSNGWVFSGPGHGGVHTLLTGSLARGVKTSCSHRKNPEADGSRNRKRTDAVNRHRAVLCLRAGQKWPASTSKADFVWAMSELPKTPQDPRRSSQSSVRTRRSSSSAPRHHEGWEDSVSAQLSAAEEDGYGLHQPDLLSSWPWRHRCVPGECTGEAARSRQRQRRQQ